MLTKEPLYQARCEIRGGEVIPLGPAWSKEAAQKVVDAMKLAIKLGKQPDAGNPHIVRVYS